MTIDSSSFEPYIPTPPELIDFKLHVARIKPNDFIIDPGCGDARVLIRAAEEYPVRCVGYEIRPGLVTKAEASIRESDLSARIKIFNEDLFTADLSMGDVFLIYLDQPNLARLAPMLHASCKPGARIVTSTFQLPGWSFIKEYSVKTHVGHAEWIFLHVAGN